MGHGEIGGYGIQLILEIVFRVADWGDVIGVCDWGDIRAIFHAVAVGSVFESTQHGVVEDCPQ